MELDIIPIGKFDKKILDALIKYLKARKHAMRVLKHAEMPEKAFNKFRKQYDAEIILEKFDRKHALFVTDKDLHMGGFNFVYGLGDPDGSAIVSTRRLRPEWYGETPKNRSKAAEVQFRKKLTDRFIKECMHEIGHMMGLKHCKNKIRGKPCAMTFSSNIHEVDAKSKELCKKCEKMLF